MSSYTVDKAPDHSPSPLYLSVAAMVAAALMAAGLPWFGSIEVTVDGSRERLLMGATAADVIASDLVDVDPGDLLSVDGEVLDAGAGEPIVLLRDGASLDPSDRVRSGDTLSSSGGDDLVEGTITTRTALPSPVVHEGSGPFEEILSPGAVGVVELEVGEVSRSVVASEVIEPAVPMVVLRRGAAPGEKAVALTFDDGPWPLYTQQIVEILDREGVKATFFMLGKQVRKYRALAAMVADSGHLVGNHSLSHVYMSAATPELARSEIENCQAEIERATGITPTWYRPAGGVTSRAVWQQTRASKVKLITWTVDPEDYRCSSPTVLANRVIDSVRPGSVILLHDGGGNRTCTVKALTTIIRELKSRGYTFVTLDEMEPG